MTTRLASVLALLLACNTDQSTTLTDGATGGTTGTSSGSGESSGAATAPTSGTGGNSGTDGGSASASGGATTGEGGTSEPTTASTEGSGGGGSGSGMACVKWYAAIYDSLRPQCECEVKKGGYDSVEECQMALAPPSDCACMVFAQDPQAVEQLHCYEMAAQDKSACLDGVDLCIDTLPLDACTLQEAAALAQCGPPSPSLCMSLKSMCDDMVPPICPP